ncbi:MULTISPECIES: polysaccharide biosynthesis protein [Brevibacillus]|jgi:FlaA1/EpsC-like NDP-sugar epimerase|uniref:polysaccharide biosynthesis protein n=1 Tax=Brevibacillus TaxID=55080 RepID=UPI00156B0EA8|nr:MULTISPECIES: nucleoside-diphosphate sugar epimerase/dehydratase [Brevibacillus]MBU8714429.1 polysaccharide biosynthesis protein [Brevibacillus parabrevis]MDH6351351.1 FlaA1/EpsC-like NDP-sugar epimerase [Brevibacillus sp. 1238]MED2254863.1 nucleoside-diphosphate sugar epimerase/dehydratase [Brevibacillus parabrevis]NRQ54422.1 polysaccharide biosynthesis protein [Brevibacillus sp. HD1.4A]UED67643.1 polysaccharide biosynthesis protein [Brevibacillus sp. HD3.3A]
MSYRKRRFWLSLSDAGIISLAVWLACLVRFDFSFAEIYEHRPLYLIIGHVLFVLAGMHLAELYRPVYRYVSAGELASIVKATSLSILILAFFLNTLGHWLWMPIRFPISLFLIAWTFVLAGITGSRFLWKWWYEERDKRSLDRRRTLIVGAGSAGVLVAREMRRSPLSEQRPIAFIDDEPSKQNLRVYGLPVIGSREDIPRIVQRHAISDIVIAMPSASRQTIRDIFDICKTTKASVKILPHVSDILSGKISMGMIRNVKLEDLLGRETVEMNLEEITGYLRQQVVLVTGAGGSIGSELCRQIARFGPGKLLLLGNEENGIFEISLELKRAFPELSTASLIADIRDRQRIAAIMSEYRPAVIFHAAAHKHVPLMEQNPSEALKNNILGTKNVAECALEAQAEHFILISTDKAVNPTSVMGATKRIAELLIQGYNRFGHTRFAAVRFGNVLGSRGSVVPIFLDQIRAGGPVTITHPEMERYFMTIPEAAQLVIQAGALAHGGEIFVLDMGKPVKIVDMAKDLIRLAGLEPEKDIPVVYTGIRSGEKLYEELLTAEEGLTSTCHDRIFIGKPLDFSWSELLSAISRLEQLAKKGGLIEDHSKMIEILQAVIPSYQSASQPVDDAKPVPFSVATG